MTTSLSKTKAKKEAPRTTMIYLAHIAAYDEWEVVADKIDLQSTSYDAYITLKVPRIANKRKIAPCIGVVELEVEEEAA